MIHISSLLRKSMTITLLLGSLVCMVSCAPYADQSGTTGKGVIPMPTMIPPTLKGMGGWYQIRMFDTKIGWVAAQNGILRTTDGGLHWTPVIQCTAQPPRFPSHSECMSSFDSATSATTTLPIEDVAHKKFVGMAINHTSDGGQTWQRPIVPVGLIFSPHFVDRVHGWLITTTEAHPGIITLFRTEDAGKSWQELSPGPHISDISDMNFQDATSGWITTTVKTDVNTSGLLHTSDGGQNWKGVPLKFPASQGISPVKFFNQQEGLFLLNTTQPPAGPFSTTIYVTHDGGKTWLQSAVAPYFLDLNDFMSMQDVWTRSDKPGEKALYVSHDGGLHWTKIMLQGVFQSLLSYNFVSTTIGFALGGTIGQSPATGVFKTTDGGHIWQELVQLNSSLQQ